MSKYDILIPPGLVFVFVALTVCNAWANDELKGLEIADGLSGRAEEAPRDSRIFMESTLGNVDSQGGSGQVSTLAIDYRGQYKLTTKLQMNISDRVDWNHSPTDINWKNTLREVNLSWQLNNTTAIDFGRINAQFGEAIAFNPTDYFREGSLRTVTSIVPSNMRNNRQGALMVRAQHLWEGGAVTAIVSPAVNESSSNAPLSLNLSSTNPKDRWLLSFSESIKNGITPQVVLAGSQKDSMQIGLNISFLPAPEFVAYFEGATGRKRSTLSSINAWPDDARQRSQVATGLTWSAADNLSITMEYDYDETGNNADQRAALARMPLAVIAAYKTALIYRQQFLNRNNFFMSGTWKDFPVPRVNLTALTRRDLDDKSQQYWLEVRNRLRKIDIALQYQVNSGGEGTTFGALRRINVLLDIFF